MYYKINDELLSTECGLPSYKSPEMLNKQSYDYKVDMWTLGILLYIMLSALPPFYHDNDDLNGLYNKIKNGKYDFVSPQFDNISNGAKDVISKLLVVDPKKRLNASQILQHEWIKDKYQEKENKEQEQEEKKDEKQVECFSKNYELIIAIHIIL